ncbi:MAG: hypothetical protein GY756_04770, partial [bacterium]|nr:hypothetical protein [bacterium]
MKLSSFILLLFLTTSLYANYEFIIEGTATGIIDGDSFNILVETELGGLSHRKINLCGIDAPELEQDHGYESWRYLSKLLNNKRVKVIYNISSLIGPISGRVYLDNDYINEILVRNGYAWYDIRLFPEFNKLAEAHEYAKSKKLALWQKRKPVPPWFWSKGQATIRSPYTLETPTKTINQVKKSTVKVFTRNGMGTGFFITNNGLILTN